MLPDPPEGSASRSKHPGLTRATVWFDGAPVTILPRRAPVGNSGPIRGRTVAVFPGAPPLTTPAPPRAMLPASVEPGDQAAFAILDLGEQEAADHGRALGLAEILFWDGRRARLLPCATE
ncbi:MAG TPA: hypothetical protein VFH48_31945 [Chloroflexota bacterium]|nr:hypothetical protein [Chloroflexota bacterium]